MLRLVDSTISLIWTFSGDFSKSQLRSENQNMKFTGPLEELLLSWRQTVATKKSLEFRRYRLTNSHDQFKLLERAAWSSHKTKAILTTKYRIYRNAQTNLYSRFSNQHQRRRKALHESEDPSSEPQHVCSTRWRKRARLQRSSLRSSIPSFPSPFLRFPLLSRISGVWA